MLLTKPLRQALNLLPGPQYVLFVRGSGVILPERAQVTALGPRKHYVSFGALLERKYCLDKMIVLQVSHGLEGANLLLKELRDFKLFQPDYI